MRIIGGQFRSRPLRSLRGLDIRPTSDRLRETLFDVLTAGNPSALEASVWLDLFAGTGAVGIEALSRGAAMVHFVEHSKKVAVVIQENLQSLGVSNGFRLVELDCSKALAKLDKKGVRPDFIFLDPPYRLQRAYQETLEMLGNSRMAERALVIVEHEKHFDPGSEFGFLQQERQLHQGDAVLSFYRRA